MTVQNAINKVNKWAEVKHDGYSYVARKGNRIIEFTRNGHSDSVATIRIRSISDSDDSQSDYTAGVFCDSIAQALRLSN